MKKKFLMLLTIILFDAVVYNAAGSGAAGRGAFAQELRQDKAMTHYNWGNEFLSNSEYKLAILEYNGTIGLMPDYYRAYYRRGNAYYLSGEYYKAINDYDKAIKLFPDYAEAYFNRGIALFNHGRQYRSVDDIRKCIDDFRETLRIEPDNAEAKKYLEMALRLLGQLLNPSGSRQAKTAPPPPQYNITIYTYNDSTRMDLDVPNSRLKIITDFPDKGR